VRWQILRSLFIAEYNNQRIINIGTCSPKLSQKSAWVISYFDLQYIFVCVMTSILLVRSGLCSVGEAMTYLTLILIDIDN